jgi:hypothetical protein
MERSLPCSCYPGRQLHLHPQRSHWMLDDNFITLSWFIFDKQTPFVNSDQHTQFYNKSVRNSVLEAFWKWFAELKYLVNTEYSFTNYSYFYFLTIRQPKFWVLSLAFHINKNINRSILHIRTAEFCLELV